MKIKDRIDGVVSRLQHHIGDISTTPVDTQPADQERRYLELADYIKAECDNLVKLINDAPDAALLPTGDRSKPPYFAIGLYERQVLDLLYEVINEGRHIMFENCDIFDARSIGRIMLVFEDTPGFYHRSISDPVQVARELGGMLARDNVFIKRRGTQYIPVDREFPYDANGKKSRKSTRTQNLWIIRNAHKYKSMGPADLHREYRRQQAHALGLYREEFDRLYPGENFYNNDCHRVIAPPSTAPKETPTPVKLEQPVTFL